MSTAKKSRGRPKLTKKKVRGARFVARCSDAELEAAQRAAKYAELPLTEFIREALSFACLLKNTADIAQRAQKRQRLGALIMRDLDATND